MLTSRGWWLLMTVLALLALAMLYSNPIVTLALVSLTLLAWFCWQWLLFAIRARLICQQVRLVRDLRDDRGPVATLWAGRSFEVRVSMRLDSMLELPFVAVADRVAFGIRCNLARTQKQGTLATGRPLEFRYRIRPPSAGKVRFEGVALQIADYHGLFYHETFIAAPVIYRVLPPLADAEGHAATVKRRNLLPPPGVHRFRRPGSGSELLELRDYLPGDPPKTIAWKISARRDRLITKEFESEVPVRCILFVDVSNSVRVGPARENALAHLVEIAATVAQADSGARDLTGLCLFDETRATVLRPARGDRHLVNLLNLLTDAAGLPPTMGKARIDLLLPLAYAFAQEVYPKRMRGDLNRFPFWMPWLWPLPTYTRPAWTLAGKIYLALFALLSLLLLVTAASDLAPYPVGFFIGLEDFLGLWPALLVGACVLVWAFTLVWEWLEVFYRAIPLWISPRQRRQARRRKCLAALLAVHFRLTPGALALLMEDDEQLALYLQRFLAEHHVPYTLPLYDNLGRYQFAAPAKINVLARSLLQAISKGHDNELYVLLADLLELTDQLEPLLRAVKVAQARHHQVLVICPWPPGIRPPDERRQTNGAKGKAAAAQVPPRPASAAPRPLHKAIRQSTTWRFHEAYYRLRRQFARLGVPLLCADSGDPVQLVLSRLNQLRVLGRHR